MPPPFQLCAQPVDPYSKQQALFSYYGVPLLSQPKPFAQSAGWETTTSSAAYFRSTERKRHTYQPKLVNEPKVDFATLISAKFDIESKLVMPDVQQVDNDALSFDSDSYDNSIGQRLQPGVRDKQLAAGLRIHYIERKLDRCKDLTRKERRALQARKNTAIFRERRRQLLAQRQLFFCDLDVIQSKVSFNLSHKFSCRVA